MPTKLQGTFSRDETGFWTAYIEQDGGVRVRHPLPVPFTATKEQAQFAFDCLLDRLERLGGNHER